MTGQAVPALADQSEWSVLIVWLEPDIPARHHRRNGMFVDHLTDLVFQQHDKIVERFDLALELDAVDQVDVHRYAFASQCVQKRILQRLTL